MGMFKLMPTRAPSKPAKIIADFDALISESIAFRFHGKDFIIRPVDTETFLKVMIGFQEAQMLVRQEAEGKVVDTDAIYDAYLKFIGPLCEDFTVKDLKSMTLSQINALIGLIIKHITGGTDTAMAESDEKKNPKI